MIRDAIRKALVDHAPAEKDYAANVKRCTCGHEVPIGDMAARTQHLEDITVAAVEALGRCGDTRPSITRRCGEIPVWCVWPPNHGGDWHHGDDGSEWRHRNLEVFEDRRDVTGAPALPADDICARCGGPAPGAVAAELDVCEACDAILREGQ